MQQLLPYFLFSLWMLVNWNQTQGQDPPEYLLTLTAEATPLTEILSRIEAQVPVQFYYQATDLPLSMVSVHSEAEPLNEVLTRTLAPYRLGHVWYRDYAIIIGSVEKLRQNYSEASFLAAYEASQQETDTLRESVISVVGDSAAMVAGAEFAIVRGTILERGADKPIAEVNISIPALGIQAQTDMLGEYLLRVPLGVHMLRVAATDYEPLEQAIRVLSNGVLDFDLDVPYYRLDEVELSARNSDVNVRAVQPGVVQLNIRELKEIPAFLGETDVIKALLNQPGVTTAGESASGFNVRGGNIDQNLLMQDGAMIFNSSHILGFFSLYNADAVENITLYKGHIPAQYGGRVASILDVQTKEGSYKRLKGEGGVGLISSRLVLDGPIQKDKTAFVAGFRSFYPVWVLPFFERKPEIRKSRALFVDGNLKIHHRINFNNLLSFSSYGSVDHFRYSDQYGFDWSTQLVSLKWNTLIRKQWSATSTLSGGNYVSSLFSPAKPGDFTLKTGMRHLKFRQNFLYAPGSQTALHVGLEGTYFLMRPETLDPRTEDSFIGSVSIPRDQGLEAAAYANLEFAVNPFLSFSVGLRYAQYRNLGTGEAFVYNPELPRRVEHIVDTVQMGQGLAQPTYGGLEPRVSGRLMLTESSSIKVSYGRHRQFVHLISNTSAATPVDLWQLSNLHIPPQVADNISIGYFRNFEANAWETSMDFYYRKLSNTVEYKDLPIILLNRALETELIAGEGQAYGAELSIRRNRGVWQGELAYTYSRSLRRTAGRFPDEVINEGNWYPSNFDSPHNIVLSVRRKVRKSQLLSINFTYRMGRPITAPISDYTIGTINVPHFSPRNLFRIPHYHRLDLSYTLKPNLVKRTRLKSDFTISVYNLYFRKNPFTLFFQKTNVGIPQTFRLAILGTVFPSLTWNFRF